MERAAKTPAALQPSPDRAGSSRIEAITDHRPVATVQRALVDEICMGPRLTAQRALMNARLGGPRMAAQRQRFGRVLGEPATLQRRPDVVQLGQKFSAPAPTYANWTAADGGYGYAAGGQQVNVTSENEDGPIGFARYVLEDIAVPSAPPAANLQYRWDDVRTRAAGRIAHLTRIENTSLTRDGPADIYRGFGNVLLARIEATARAEGATMMYLEPAPSPSRTSPDDNVKAVVDPTGFYTHNGYGYDAVAVAHNNAYVETEFADLSAEQRATMKTQINAAALGGVMQKLL